MQFQKNKKVLGRIADASGFCVALMRPSKPPLSTMGRMCHGRCSIDPDSVQFRPYPQRLQSALGRKHRGRKISSQTAAGRGESGRFGRHFASLFWEEWAFRDGQHPKPLALTIPPPDHRPSSHSIPQKSLNNPCRPTHDRPHASPSDSGLSWKRRDLSSPRSVLRSLVAVANSAGGHLLLGVADDRQIIGVESPLDEEELLSDLIENSIAPQHIPNRRGRKPVGTHDRRARRAHPIHRSSCGNPAAHPGTVAKRRRAVGTSRGTSRGTSQ